MRRKFRRREAIRDIQGDEELDGLYEVIFSHFPERPIRRRHRHSRLHIRKERIRALHRAERLVDTWNYLADDDDRWKQKIIHQFATDRKPGSSDNRRQWDGDTIQQRREADREAFEDFDNSPDGQAEYDSYCHIQSKIRGLDEPEMGTWEDHPS